jgi:hydrogenase nickel incorporation protein HypA/HybF
MESLVAAVTERVGESRVVVVRLEIGRLAAVMPEALRFCFDVCARGTPLEGAELELVEIPAVIRCRRCGNETVLDAARSPCICGGFDFDVLGGEDLKIVEVEVA